MRLSWASDERNARQMALLTHATRLRVALVALWGGFEVPLYSGVYAEYMPSIWLCGGLPPFLHSALCLQVLPARPSRREPGAVKRKNNKYPRLDAPRHRF